MIISNKQRHEHNNLVTIQRTKLKETHERSKNFHSLELKTKMKTLTRMGNVVIEDYYHMTKMDEIWIG